MVNVSGQSIGYVTAITRFDTKYCNPFKKEFKIGLSWTNAKNKESM